MCVEDELQQQHCIFLYNQYYLGSFATPSKTSKRRNVINTMQEPTTNRALAQLIVTQSQLIATLDDDLKDVKRLEEEIQVVMF